LFTKEYICFSGTSSEYSACADCAGATRYWSATRSWTLALSDVTLNTLNSLSTWRFDTTTTFCTNGTYPVRPGSRMPETRPNVVTTPVVFCGTRARPQAPTLHV